MKLGNLTLMEVRRQWIVALCVFVIAVVMSQGPRLFAATDEQRFNSPDEAVNALTTAAKARDTNALHAIFGPEAHDLTSPDIVQAADEFNMFAQRLTEKVQMVTNSDSQLSLDLGADAWPFPIPLVKQGGQWFFDTDTGKEEILNRRIGANELGAIQVCHSYVTAQYEYASKDRNADEVLEYAERLRSTTGTHDGLYWHATDNEELSPFGPLISEAHSEGYRRQNKIMTDAQAPYHGYYFKILTRQGKHAPGGKYNYIINGHMIAGFALIAWPAEWGNSGIMTFIVNQRGKVYEKNLGPKTSTIAARIKAYDPDETWSLVKSE